MSEKTKQRVDKIEALRKNGVTVEAACKEVGITSSAYYQNRTKGKRVKKSKLKVFEMPQVQSSGRAFIVFGSPADLAEFARSYS